MAVVNSLAVGKATKTAGELTYAKVRGRTIARRRITSNKSNTKPQQNQRFTFGVVSSMAAIIDPYIKANFEPTEFGSARNCFIKKNWPVLKNGYSTEVPAEMSLYSVLFDLINAQGYLQFGVGFEGSLTVRNVDETNMQFSVEVIDKSYNSVETYLLNSTNRKIGIRKTTKQPTLVNGVWTATNVGYTINSGFNFSIVLLYIDGKPVINTTGGYIKVESGGL